MPRALIAGQALVYFPLDVNSGQVAIIPRSCRFDYDRGWVGYNSQSMLTNGRSERFPFLKGIALLAVGLVFFGWLLNTPEGVLGKADAIGYAVCHRIDVRSFHLGTRQLPLCARCSGMYLGAMTGLLYQAVRGKRRSGMPPWRVTAVLVALVVAFAIDGLNSYLTLFPGAPNAYQPQNWLRLLTGTGMGVAISGLLYPAFNQTVWSDVDNRPALDGLGFLGLLLALAAGVAVILLTEIPALLYPLALISATGVLVLLTMVYSMLILMVLRRENRYTKVTQLLLPLVGGFGFGLLQIAALDLVRYLLTGTWEGFHLG